MTAFYLSKPYDPPQAPQNLPLDLPWALLGGNSPQQFMKAYWHKRPLLVRGAIPAFEISKKLGESLMGAPETDMPKVGREWDETGWLVKEMYVLRREDEIAWNVKRSGSSRPGVSTIFLKIDLVPKPGPGIKAGIDYMLRAPTSTRLIAVRVTMAHERVFGHCQRQVAEQACYQAGEKMGLMPRMTGGRMPASKEFQCGGSEGYKVQCLMPDNEAPIWRCNN